jgi:hypothetical protein
MEESFCHTLSIGRLRQPKRFGRRSQDRRSAEALFCKRVETAEYVRDQLLAFDEWNRRPPGKTGGMRIHPCDKPLMQCRINVEHAWCRALGYKPPRACTSFPVDCLDATRLAPYGSSSCLCLGPRPNQQRPAGLHMDLQAMGDPKVISALPQHCTWHASALCY